MIELTAIGIGKGRCLLNPRSFAPAFLALAMSLGLPLGAAAQVVYEFVVDPITNTTLVRCFSPVPLVGLSSYNCTGQDVRLDCNGEVTAVVQDLTTGLCDTRPATGAETRVLITEHELVVDIIITALDSQTPEETPGGGDPPPVPIRVPSTTSNRPDSNPSSPGIDTAPALR